MHTYEKGIRNELRNRLGRSGHSGHRFSGEISRSHAEHIFLQAVKNAQNLLHTADEMDIPIVVTEQYPEGLGSTIQGLSEWSRRPSVRRISVDETR